MTDPQNPNQTAPRVWDGVLGSSAYGAALALLESAGYAESDRDASGSFRRAFDDMDPRSGVTTWYLRVVEDPARPILDRLRATISAPRAGGQ